jgi:hypothetical protein
LREYINLPRDHLSPKIFPTYLVPLGTSYNNSMKNIKKWTITIPKPKISQKVTFFGLKSHYSANFFNDTFAASSRDQICEDSDLPGIIPESSGTFLHVFFIIWWLFFAVKRLRMHIDFLRVSKIRTDIKL